MPEDLPAPEIIQELHQQFFVGNDSSGESSHWREMNQHLDVELDSKGVPISLVGHGFGNVSWSSRLERVIDRLAVWSHMVHVPNRRSVFRCWKLAKDVCRDMGIAPTLDVFRQACSLALIQTFLSSTIRNPSVVVIGDGHGVLSAMIKQSRPDARLTLIDLGTTLLFQAYRCQQAHPQSEHALAKDATESTDFTYCASPDVSTLLAKNFDLAVNIASFQEIDPKVTKEYMRFLRETLQPDNLFYCCNRINKTLPDGTVTKFDEYGWQAEDRILIEENCQWHQYFFSTSKVRNKRRVLGMAIPLVAMYDGGHRHVLAQLRKSPS